jgi:hypothetical protein
MTTRTAMARGGPLERRAAPLPRTAEPERRAQLVATGPIRPSAASRTRARAVFAARALVLRAMFEEDPWCRARIDGVCTGLAEDGHEPLLRSRGGDPTDPANIVLLCRKCHDHAHANPRVAEALGLMRHSWDAA